MWGLGELDLAVLDHLPAVAPRVEEIQIPTWQDLRPRLLQRLAHGLFAVDDETYMTVIIRPVLPTLGEGDELIASVDERHPASTPTQLYLEEAPVELQGLLDVADLEGD